MDYNLTGMSTVASKAPETVAAPAATTTETPAAPAPAPAPVVAKEETELEKLKKELALSQKAREEIEKERDAGIAAENARNNKRFTAMAETLGNFLAANVPEDLIQQAEALQKDLVSTNQLGAMHPSQTRTIQVVASAFGNMQQTMSARNAEMTAMTDKLRKSEEDATALRSERDLLRKENDTFKQHQEAAGGIAHSEGMFPFSSIASRSRTTTVTTAGAGRQTKRPRPAAAPAAADQQKQMMESLMSYGSSAFPLMNTGIDPYRPASTFDNSNYTPYDSRRVW